MSKRRPDAKPNRQRTTTAAERDETEAERADRNLTDIVQELRVAQTGVQILFAFLISLPFLAGFPSDRTSALVLTAALFSAAGATIVFITPVAFHRWSFQKGLKRNTVLVAHRLASLGLALLALSMGLSIWLFLSSVWSSTVANVSVSVLLCGVAGLWWAAPALMFRK